MEDAGPDISTLYRWVRALLGPLILPWLREKLDGVPVESFREDECSRSQAVRVIRAGEALARKHAPTPEALDFSPYLQLARLASM